VLIGGVWTWPIQARTISWTAPTCGGNQACSNLTAGLNGGACSNLASGECDTSEFKDCQDDVFTLSSGNCVCPGSTPADDRYPVDAESKDSSEGCNDPLSILKGGSLGDQCGSDPRKVIEVCVPDGPCECPSRGEGGKPVRYASGQMRTVPQIDFVIDDPFFPVRFEREYSSGALVDNVLGWGWRHNDDIKLHENPTAGSFRLSRGGKSFWVVPYSKIIDNDNGSGAYENAATFVGPWTVSTAANSYISVNFAHDNNTGNGTKSARFTPFLSYDGRYEVYIHYNSGADRASNVPVHIYHDGIDTVQYVNMKTGGGTWKSLGIYGFRAGNQAYAEIQTGGTSGYLIADAMLFTYREQRSIDGKDVLVAAGAPGEYDLMQSDGTVYHFDASSPHRLMSIENVDGRRLLFGYDPNGLLQSITTPAGRVVSFAYVQSGGKSRIASISSGSQVLVQYQYTTAAVEGVDGRLKSVTYPEDGSGYLYTYAALDPLKRLLERVEDLGGKVVEEHVWGYHPVTGGWVVTSTASGSEQLDLSYSTRFVGGPGSPGQRKTVVTRHIDASTTDSYEVEWDFHGRVNRKTGGCSSCGHSTIYDQRGNPVVETGATGKTMLSRYDNQGRKLSESQVTVQTDQVLSGTEEFDGSSVISALHFEGR
jgi:YD repeat-containing protein